MESRFKHQIFSVIFNKEFPAKYNTQKWLSIRNKQQKYGYSKKNGKYDESSEKIKNSENPLQKIFN